MKQIEILATAPLIPGVMQTLDDTYVVHRLWEAPDRAALLAEHGRRIRGIATNGSVGAGAALLDQLPVLEIISCFGVGVDAIDLASAARRGIAVTTTPGVLVEDVADQALALLLAVSRNIVAADRHVREGKWASSELALTRRVSGKKAGILGLGDIGVFWDEPHPSPSFSTFDNVVLAPHAASGTVETRAAMGQLVIDNLAAHFAGKPLLTPYPNFSIQVAA